MRPIKLCFNKQLAELCQRSVLLEELAHQIKRYLPPELATCCQVGSFEKGCLTLTTTHSGWATQLRYALPELRDKLRKEAGMYQLSSIKITLIEPPSFEPPNKAPRRHTLSERAKTTILSESQNCQYQPLKKALLHLATGDMKEKNK